MINIKDLDKAEVLLVLYNNAKIYKNKFLNKKLSFSDCKNILKRYNKFLFINGKALDVNLSDDEFDSKFYDKYNGDGLAKNVIDFVRAKNNIIDSNPLSGDTIDDDFSYTFISQYEKDNGFKRLIYTTDYYEYNFNTLFSCDNDNFISAYFEGKDIRTGEVLAYSFDYCVGEDVNIDYFGFNDVLGMIYEKGFLIRFFNDELPSFQDVRKDYINLKELGIDESEINDILLEKYNKRSVKIRSL